MLADQSYSARVAQGKGREDTVLRNLFNIIPVEKFEPASAKEDMIDKLDGYITAKNGRRNSIQIKIREDERPDLLVDCYEPFFGLDHPETKLGRDMVSKCDYYVCQSGDHIHLVSAGILRGIAKEIVQEWEQAGASLLNRTFESTKHRGAQLKFTSDRSSGRFKMLAFVPPTLFSKGQIISGKVIEKIVF